MEVKEKVAGRFKNVFSKKDEKTSEPGKKKKSKKKLIRNIIIIVLVLAVLGGALAFFMPKKDTEIAAVISARAAVRGDVTNYLSGSGMIEAMDSYDIVAKVQGDILSAPFEEGEIVNEDDVLYVFDSSDAQQSLRSQQNSYDSQRISYQTEQKKWEKFTVKAPVSGYVTGISSSLHVGDDISNGSVLATINAQNVEINLPFAASAYGSIQVGSQVQLSSAKYMTNSLYGTVADVDNVYAGSFNVKINFTNPGQIAEGDLFAASVNGIHSAATGACTLAHAVKAEIKGEITSINVKNGDFVTEGTTLFVLDDEDTKNSLRQNQISFDNAGINLEKAYDTLDNYTIKSPITGTVIQKNYKAGDTLGNSSNSAILATIADISKMKFTINVDELDISGVQLGQKVQVTADAMADKVFEGEITKIIQQGTGSSGVTTYPVEVTIAEPGELKIGMNVTGTVVMSSAKNVIKVPLEAVSMRGGKTYVQVLKEDVRKKVFGDAAPMTMTRQQAETAPQEKLQTDKTQGEKTQSETPQGERPSGDFPRGEMPQGERPSGDFPRGEMPQGERPSGDFPRGEMPQGERPNGNFPQGEMPQGEKPSGATQADAAPANDNTKTEKAQGEKQKGDATQNEKLQGNTQENNKGTNAENTGKKDTYTFTDDDFELREVTTGVSSDSEIEIISGLEEGEYVKIVRTVNNSTNNRTGGMSGMGGMGMGGGMPSMGMGGGMRTGGMSGGMRTGGANMGGGMRTGGMGGR